MCSMIPHLWAHFFTFCRCSKTVLLMFHLSVQYTVCHRVGYFEIPTLMGHEFLFLTDLNKVVSFYVVLGYAINSDGSDCLLLLRHWNPPTELHVSINQKLQCEFPLLWTLKCYKPLSVFFPSPVCVRFCGEPQERASQNCSLKKWPVKVNEQVKEIKTIGWLSLSTP